MMKVRRLAKRRPGKIGREKNKGLLPQFFSMPPYSYPYAYLKYTWLTEKVLS